MNEHNIEAFLRALDLEDSLPGTTSAQKEANEFRRKTYLSIVNRKPNDSATSHFDMQLHMYGMKMTNPSFRFSASTLMKE